MCDRGFFAQCETTQVHEHSKGAGLGPIGQMSTRIASDRGAGTVIGIDPVSERRDMAARHGIRTLDPTGHADLPSDIRDLTDGRGPDSVIDPVGIEAHRQGHPTAHGAGARQAVDNRRSCRC